MCVKSGLPTRTWVAMAAQVPGPQDRAEDRGARQEVHREAHDLDEADRDQRRHGIAELYGPFDCRRRAAFIAASRVRNATAMPLNTRPARTADFEDEVTIGRGNAVESDGLVLTVQPPSNGFRGLDRARPRKSSVQGWLAPQVPATSSASHLRL